MPKKLKKHPMQMTDEEALHHLFHPKIAKAVKKHVEEQKNPKPQRNHSKSARTK